MKRLDIPSSLSFNKTSSKATPVNYGEHMKNIAYFITFHFLVSFAFAAERPNVLVILCDDLGYGDLSCYGAPDLKTPRIDSLATEGMKFTRFRANSNVWSPSRAALLSGMYPDRAGVPGVIRTHDDDNWGYLSRNLTLLPAVLKKQGYHTAIVGKWHLGLESPNLPNERGFDYFLGFLGDMMDDYYTHLRHEINYMRFNGETIDPKGHATDLFSDWACDYLRDRAAAKDGQPFFLYLAYNAPHVPVQPPQDYLDRVKEREPGIGELRAKLVALIEHLDDGVGRVLDTLKETGLDRDTLVIFTSDNGGQKSAGATCGPHRGEKGEMYEGGLKIPFLVRRPGFVQSGTQTDVQAVLMDVFPTVLQSAGVNLDTPEGIYEQKIDGVTLCDVFSGQAGSLPARPLYFVRREGGLGFGGKTSNALVDGDWKLLQNTPFSPLEFYNLHDDPLEQRNLGTNPTQEFRSLFQRMMRQIQAGGQTPWQSERRGEIRPVAP